MDDRSYILALEEDMIGV